jgi:hypothetical protein
MDGSGIRVEELSQTARQVSRQVHLYSTTFDCGKTSAGLFLGPLQYIVMWRPSQRQLGTLCHTRVVHVQCGADHVSVYSSIMHDWISPK